MYLNEARETVVDQLIDRELFTPDHYWVLLADEENPGLKAVRLGVLAGKLSLWEEAEILSNDPTIQDTPFGDTPDGNLCGLGIQAAQLGDIDQARKFFSRMEYPTYDMDVHVVDGLLKAGRLDEAEDTIRRKSDFNDLQDLMHKRLRGLVYQLCKLEGGPKRALDLVSELVPDPSTSDIQDKQMERSRMDYFVDQIPAAALLQGDNETAERAVSMAYDMLGRPAAMGGGGLVDEAYATGNESIVNAVKELIRKKQNSQTA